ncbi:MAG TPA: hypothetical protein PKA00_21325 [Saprospiraceae bacterium]|nr:hypothetical protein [Saprospiraceae bacterium]HMQ85466.1 hypothetical protein [Saprospiraceae bacterium]
MQKKPIEIYQELIEAHTEKLPLCLLLGEVKTYGNQARQKTASLCEDQVVQGQVMKNRTVYKLPLAR